MKDQSVAFEQYVWDVLSRTDVNDHIDHLPKTGKRPAVSYLAWHKAWTLLKRKFPGSTYSHRPDVLHADGSMEVEVDVAITINGTETQFANARLAVMDNYFGPITNPNARQINDARQRCLVKALAFAGLGLNLWSESVIPVGKLDDPITPEQYDTLTGLLEETDSDVDKFLRWCGVEELSELPFERYGSALHLLNAKLGKQKRAKREATENA